MTLSVLLLAAGALQAVAATIRWAPCIRDLGGMECALIQNHTFDYKIVSQPFEAIPVAVPLAGISSLLLAAFWFFGARSLPALQSRSASVTRIFCIGAAAVFALVGVSQLLAAASGSAFGVAGYAVGLVVWFAATAVPITASALLIATSTGVRVRIAWGVPLLATLAGDQLVEYVLLEPINPSYDSPPGVGYPGAVGLVLAGIAFAVAAYTAARSRTAAPAPAPGPADPASGPRDPAIAPAIDPADPAAGQPRPAQSLSNPFS
ncbi:hypothetical protein B7R21_16365 [Subtercola boreus]|uniref:DUF998 domain-containing protein n=1 Tax=Subtercola boreus TaxID=120213 RepID=A0A3E0VBF4_9MICO|nr:hypothetical protein [Subtercola boreus]RFA07164.1 hypothetical protein B7R21_16365 [Subtercola boreus]